MTAGYETQTSLTRGDVIQVKGQFDLNDFLSQIRQMNKMGGIGGMGDTVYLTAYGGVWKTRLGQGTWEELAEATSEPSDEPEVEEIVEPGELDPNQIQTPGIYVDRLIQGSFEKRIEQLTVTEN